MKKFELARFGNLILARGNIFNFFIIFDLFFLYYYRMSPKFYQSLQNITLRYGKVFMKIQGSNVELKQSYSVKSLFTSHSLVIHQLIPWHDHFFLFNWSLNKKVIEIYEILVKKSSKSIIYEENYVKFIRASQFIPNETQEKTCFNHTPSLSLLYLSYFIKDFHHSFTKIIRFSITFSFYQEKRNERKQ